jgi:lipid-A-disaccharide synthase
VAKIYLIAGEISGDFIGSHLMQATERLYKSEKLPLEFTGIGGSQMEQAGLGNSLFPINQINLMGFVEIIPHLFTIAKLINHTVADIVQHAPDLLITIDSPGFTYRVAKKVRKILPDLKIIHIVAPSIWAYKPSRALKYAKVYNYLLALLPFEPPYFQQVGLNCQYIGHPIIEQNYYNKRHKDRLRQELQISIAAQLLCVTCGSRLGEITKHLPIFIAAINLVAKQFKDLEVIFVMADLNHQSIIESFLPNAEFAYHFSIKRLKAFAAADLALAKSGTNILEIAASGTPMIIAYKLNILSFLLVRLLIKIPYVSLINIIAGKEVIKELIQFNCHKTTIASELISLLDDHQKVNIQIATSEQILKQLGFKSHNSPSAIAANIIKSEILGILS